MPSSASADSWRRGSGWQWLAEQGFELLQVAAIERAWTAEGHTFGLAQLQACGVAGLRAELAEKWEPGLEISATWLNDGADAAAEKSAELLLNAAQTEVKRLRLQLHKATWEKEEERVRLKAELVRLDGTNDTTPTAAGIPYAVSGPCSAACPATAPRVTICCRNLLYRHNNRSQCVPEMSIQASGEPDLVPVPVPAGRDVIKHVIKLPELLLGRVCDPPFRDRVPAAQVDMLQA